MKHIEDVYFSNLNMICNMGGYFSISPKVDWSCKDDVFEQCKFYFITEGSCVIIIRGKSYVARAGDWFLIPSYEKHTFWNEKTENFSKYWMHFDVYPDNRFFESLGLPFVIHLDDIEKIEKLFKKFTTLNKSNDLSDKLTVKAIGFELLSNYVKLSSDSGVDVVSVSSETVDGILRYVNKNLSADLTDKALAEKFFMHKNHLVKIFSSKVGMSPSKYVTATRMQTAKRLLESTDLTVREISFQIGLKDETHLSKLFQKHYNMSPAKYRKYTKTNR